MYLLQSDKINYGIKLPTSIDEISSEVLQKITKDIELKPYYTLVCLAYRTTLFNLASQVKGKIKEDSIGIIPIVAKVAADAADKDSTNLPVKGSDALIRPIIAPSSIERGYEVNIPTAASFNHVLRYINNDNDLRIELFQKKYVRNLQYEGKELTEENIHVDNSTPVYLLGFKVVANNDIVATVPIHHSIDDVFVEEIGE